jgi:hypothetical protein
MRWPIHHPTAMWRLIVCGAVLPLVASLGRGSPKAPRITTIVTCCMCDKVRDERRLEGERAAWREFSMYSATHSLRMANVALLQTFCPDCLQSYRKVLASACSAKPQHETITKIENARS